MKYSLKQTVWFMCQNRPTSSRVNRIRNTMSIHEDYEFPSPDDKNSDVKITEYIKTDIEYEVFNGTYVWMSERELFPTKETLVASLLE